MTRLIGGLGRKLLGQSNQLLSINSWGSAHQSLFETRLAARELESTNSNSTKFHIYYSVNGRFGLTPAYHRSNSVGRYEHVHVVRWCFSLTSIIALSRRYPNGSGCDIADFCVCKPSQIKILFAVSKNGGLKAFVSIMRKVPFCLHLLVLFVWHCNDCCLGLRDVPGSIGTEVASIA